MNVYICIYERKYEKMENFSILSNVEKKVKDCNMKPCFLFLTFIFIYVGGFFVNVYANS